MTPQKAPKASQISDLRGFHFTFHEEGMEEAWEEGIMVKTMHNKVVAAQPQETLLVGADRAARGAWDARAAGLPQKPQSGRARMPVTASG